MTGATDGRLSWDAEFQESDDRRVRGSDGLIRCSKSPGNERPERELDVDEEELQQRIDLFRDGFPDIELEDQ